MQSTVENGPALKIINFQGPVDGDQGPLIYDPIVQGPPLPSISQ